MRGAVGVFEGGPRDLHHMWNSSISRLLHSLEISTMWECVRTRTRSVLLLQTYSISSCVFSHEFIATNKNIFSNYGPRSSVILFRVHYIKIFMHYNARHIIHSHDISVPSSVFWGVFSLLSTLYFIPTILPHFLASFPPSFPHFLAVCPPLL